ncbi:MAG: hypothetical protein WKG07_15880 [Hymenobacter sp.]
MTWAAPPALAGCCSTQATNYNPAARRNDGSCQYAPTAASARQGPLDAAVPETSGLQLAAGLWTFNDSGNPPVLFQVDSATGRAAQQVRVVNYPNTDWEDITADARYLYLGDFGNNYGTRRDLRLLRVPRAGLGPAADTVSAQAINFYYPDQTTFGGGLNNHDYDCEAVFSATTRCTFSPKTGPTTAPATTPCRPCPAPTPPTSRPPLM